MPVHTASGVALVLAYPLEPIVIGYTTEWTDLMEKVEADMSLRGGSISEEI